MKKNFIAGMTLEEFRDTVNQGTVIVVPVGSTELEGTHLPLGADTIMHSNGLPGYKRGGGYRCLPYGGADKGESILMLISDFARAFILEFRGLAVE